MGMTEEQFQQVNRNTKAKAASQIQSPTGLSHIIDEVKRSRSKVKVKPMPTTAHVPCHDHHDIPPKYRRWRLSDYKESVQDAVVAFLADPDEWSLYLWGGMGTRKTSIAAAAMIEWRSQRPPPTDQSGIFLPPYRVARSLAKLETAVQTVENWGKSQFLVLDDIGAFRNTEHVVGHILHLFQQRYDSELKTIITGNLDLAGVGKHVDPRVADRLQEASILKLEGTSCRGKET